MTPTHEEWRPIAGYEGAYEVSSEGRVRSLDRLVNAGQRGGKRTIRGKILATPLGSNGYLHVSLRKRTYSVHSLVAAAFLGERPDGFEVCHCDGDALNNRAANLRYDTVSANRLDIIRHGRHHQVAKTHCPQGHPYDAENTGRASKGARRCLTCHRESERARYERKRYAEAV